MRTGDIKCWAKRRLTEGMKHKILIIDDEEDFAQMLKLNLEEQGEYEVVVENQAINALAKTLEYQPELIFLDIIMPDMEGPDVLNQIRRHDQIKDTPVVFLTATVRKEEVEAEGGMIGGHPFLAKPSTIEELIQCIEETILKFDPLGLSNT